MVLVADGVKECDNADDEENLEGQVELSEMAAVVKDVEETKVDVEILDAEFWSKSEGTAWSLATLLPLPRPDKWYDVASMAFETDVDEDKNAPDVCPRPAAT